MVHFEDGKLKIADRYYGILFRNIAFHLQDKTRQRITFAFHLIKGIGRQVHYLTGVMDHGAAFENIGDFIYLAIAAFFLVKFIAYIAYHFFQNIFERNNAAGTTEFI